MKPSKEVIEAINEIHTTNDKVEKLIHNKNRHSIYHMCIRHGFGIHFPFDNKCPSCDNETYLYISADDILSLLQQQREEILREVGNLITPKTFEDPDLCYSALAEIEMLVTDKLRSKLQNLKKV